MSLVLRAIREVDGILYAILGPAEPVMPEFPSPDYAAPVPIVREPYPRFFPPAWMAIPVKDLGLLND